MYKCEYCGIEIMHKRNATRHIKGCKQRGVSEVTKFRCSKCDKMFSRQDAVIRHEKTCAARKRSSNSEEDASHPAKKQRCNLCNIDVINLHSHLRSITHKNMTCIPQDCDEYVHIIDSAYKSRIATYRISSCDTHLTPNDFMLGVKVRTIKLITKKQAEVESAVKVNLELFACYSKWVQKIMDDDNTEEIEEIKSFNTKNRVIPFVTSETEIDEIYCAFTDEIMKKADEFQERDSGWALKEILHLEVNINKYAPLNGSSYLPLPTWIKEKHACINVKNNDEACFFWAVVSALYQTHDSDRISCYPYYKEVLNVNNINLPVTIEDVKKFEQINDISINIFEINGKSIAGPIYHTKQRRQKHINLLLIEEGEKSHYVWIKNMSRLIKSQLTKHKTRVWICDGCLLSFTSKLKFIEHYKRDCSQIKTSVPEEDNNILKFKNIANQLRVPVVVYADFEALLIPISGCEPKNSSAYTMDYQRHDPYSFGYFIKCSFNDSLSKYVSYRGEDCVQEFLKSLEKELAPFIYIMNKVIPIHPLTNDQNCEFLSAVNCHICHEAMGTDRVRDHDHLTGEYRGAAHSKCNLAFKIKPFIPIVFHNLSKYDSHFIIRMLRNHNIHILPKNKENFISFTSMNHSGLSFNLRFIDSYRFLASSLEKLVANLSQDQFKILPALFSTTTTNTSYIQSAPPTSPPPPPPLHLLTRKGVFPYEYVDDWSKFYDTSLPSKASFFSKMSNSHISDADYIHAKNVWYTFNIQNLGEYSDLYLKTDVLLLADCFENFRNVCMDTYNLDPAHYYTAPGLSWDAMLHSTKVEMELLTDISMVKFISNGIRGGLSQCCNKYAAANNKYLHDFDPSKESSYIAYLDANNQYGWAMSRYIPLKDFHWLPEGEIEKFDVMCIPANASTGYILEVDLDYPNHLHDLHNDLCFCPENRIPEMSRSKTQKLLSNLHCKRYYAIHYMNLKQALKHGLQLKKIHRILAFHQSPWLKSYIDMNTEKRTAARNSFEKDFYKLMNNAVFGKTMENVDKRVDIRLVNRWESAGKRLGARALISRLNFHSCMIIDEDLSIIQMRRNSVKYDKPIYVGFTVLELSKTLMYDFHYSYMKPKYGDNVQLLYTDTDSFLYWIKTDDFYEDIKPDLQTKFDTSDYPPNNRYNLPLVNKKVVGMFKDKCLGVIIREFIGIRSKCYFIEKENESVIKKIKGIKRNVVNNEVLRKDFIMCVNDRECSKQYRSMSVIRSKAHQLYSQTLNKAVLDNYDDKRFLIPVPPYYDTLAWGHSKIDKYYFI